LHSPHAALSVSAIARTLIALRHPKNRPCAAKNVFVGQAMDFLLLGSATDTSHQFFLFGIGFTKNVFQNLKKKT